MGSDNPNTASHANPGLGLRIQRPLDPTDFGPILTPQAQAAFDRLQKCSLHLMTPMYGGQATINYIESTMALMLACERHGIPFSHYFIYNESLISRARNRSVDNYLKTCDFTHSVFIDSDIGYDWRDVFLLMGLDLDVVGCPCSKKSIRWDRVEQAVIGSFTPNGKRELTKEDYERVAGDHVVNWLHEGTAQIDLGQPQQVKTVGTGLMMVRRNIYEEFIEQYPDRWYEGQLRSDPMCHPGKMYDFFHSGVNPETRRYESEDYAFCNDVRNMGKKVWLAPWVRTTHMGTYSFQGDLAAVSALTGGIADRQP